ncbi:MAG: discoidin domain-containing protein [Muribaculaceae bacterium]|nr:discoidin domain-containing protein [Muribaculaceae bacterium]
MAVLTLMVEAQPTHNRPIGTYPGNPDEYFGPALVEGGGYRNLALHRMVWQSSACDFNLTSHLLTDGIIHHGEAAWLRVTTPNGERPVHQRESAIDGNDWTCNIVMGGDTWLQYDWQGMSVDVDEVEMVCSMAYRPDSPQGFELRLHTSTDGLQWQVADQWQGDTLPGNASRRRAHSDPNKNSDDDSDLLPTRSIRHTFHISHSRFSHLRMALRAPAAAHWTITELKMHRGGSPAAGILPATRFTSAWRSAGTSGEWVTIDLGGTSIVDKVRLHWLGTPAKGHILVSDDNANWKTAATLPSNMQHAQEVTLGYASCRYVRVTMSESRDGEPMCLTEIEVLGTGGVRVQPHASGGWQGRQWLLDGGDWRLQRASQVTDDGAQVSSSGFDTTGWFTATVPATVLSSFVNAGALPDMNHDDNLLLASESFFGGDFWYRRTFDLPEEFMHRRVILHLDGINWKAEVWLNGTLVDRIDGAFKRGLCDITRHLHDTDNVLAIRIIANAHPGGVKLKTERNTDYNGGILGADNPTFHATVGWDWISTIRGRDIGIWDDMYLTASGDVTLSDPVVTTTLGASDTLATMTPAVRLTNHDAHRSVTGLLRGSIGDIHFQRLVAIPPDTTIEAVFSPEAFPELCGQTMRLWWPNGYGEPYLYDASFMFVADGQPGDSLHYRAGIREVTTTGKDSCLRIYVNHRRVVSLGGNWAFSENNLNYRGREYDAAVRHHREMNCNMIRNWVGMTADREFYEACDRHGIMVWQDFWLANPADGPDPADEAMFTDNARDLMLKIRRHPCLTIYCGRNEGYPPPSLDSALRHLVATLHPGLDYISSSADDGVSGHGPYHALHPEEYFTRQTGKLHTERGMPCVMTIEGLRRTLDDAHLWPQNEYWGRHDFTREGAQRGEAFNLLIEESFGTPQSAEEFTQWAQWVNFEGYRAMYESGSRDRMGLLIWMSHPCWPSMVWQTYDYYLEPTAAYFGVKHACEPLHVQWNPVSDRVEVVNRSAGFRRGAASATFIGIDGTVLRIAEQPFTCKEDTTVNLSLRTTPPDYEGVYIMRLELRDEKGKSLSVNDYVRSTTGHDRRALRLMPTVTMQATASVDGTQARVTITNTSSVPAMMLRLNLKGDDGEQILPVVYSDNYLHLLPGESRTITIEWNAADARGTTPVVEITGTNVKQCSIRLL